MELNESKSFNVKIDRKTYDFLVSDSIDFKIEKINTLINRIFKSFAEEYQKNSLQNVLETGLEKILGKARGENILSSDRVKRNEQLREILEPLRKQIYPSTDVKKNSETIQLNFRLSTENTEYFLLYLNTVVSSNSYFFRECFEWYRRKSKYEREKIVCMENYNKLLEAAKEHRVVQIRVWNKGKIEIYETYPCALIASRNENFNYLLSVDKKTKNIYPTRLSNIRKVMPTGEWFKKITDRNLTEKELKENKMGKAQTEDINMRIKNREITLGEKKKIVLELTEEGYSKFKIIVHNRPTQTANFRIDKREEGRVRMEFEATEDAVKYYFLAFGSDCKIIETERLKESFKKFYEDAAKIYGGSGH
ncbi:MAG: WYL domain-containing protein [Fusobacteriaceae bacterium]